MGPSKPISPRDLRRAENAVTIIRKFQEVVSGVRKRVEPVWTDKLFGENTGSKQVSDGIGMGCLPFWWYRTKAWRKRGIGGFYLAIGIDIYRQAPHFYIALGSSQKKFANSFESKFDKIFREFKKHGWQKETEPGWDWCYSKLFLLGDGDIERIAEKQSKNVISATKALQASGTIKLLEKRVKYPMG